MDIRQIFFKNRSYTPIPLVLKVKEAAQILRISVVKVHDLIKEGTIAAIRFGKKILIPVAEIRRLLGEAGVTDSEIDAKIVQILEQPNTPRRKRRSVWDMEFVRGNDSKQG